MKLTVRKCFCPFCGETQGRNWTVTDSDGFTCYVSRTWRNAIDYAYGATQPGTGDQVQNTNTHTERHDK